MRVTGKRAGGAVTQTAPEKKTKPEEQAKPGKSRQDFLELSRKAADFLTEQTRRMTEEIGKIGQEGEEGSGGTSLIDHYKKQMDIMDKCAKISASISKGNRVPPEDLRYLKQHDMNAYRLAMITRKPKHNPKDEESVLSEEDIAEMEGRVTQEGGTASPEPAPAVSGGE